MYDDNKKTKRGETETLKMFSYYGWSSTSTLEGRKLNVDTKNHLPL